MELFEREHGQKDARADPPDKKGSLDPQGLIRPPGVKFVPPEFI